MENKETKKKINIKELLADKRKRSILFLAFYLIFFIFVFAIISATKNNEKSDNLVKNYVYKYDIIFKSQNEEKNISYVRQLYNSKEYITKKINQDEENYYYDGNDYYRLNNETKKYEKISNVSVIYEEIDARLLDADNYVQFMEGINPTIKNIRDIAIAEYNVSSKKVINVYNEFGKYQQKNFEISNDDKINISSYSKNNTTFKISMDLTNLLKYYLDDINQYIVTMEQSDLINFKEPKIEIE
jgi:hypothetical protein